MRTGRQTVSPLPAASPASRAGEYPNPVEWSLDPAQGTIQGPLDLAFFRDHQLLLHLEADQVGLLTREGHLDRILLGGRHLLNIGQGRNRIAPEHELVLMVLDQVFPLNWTRLNPVSWGPEPCRPLLGECTVGIRGPAAFFNTFMAGSRHLEPAFLQRLIDQTVRGLLEQALTGADFDPASVAFPELQARISRLGPDLLQDQLAVFGLTCTGLAVYTAAPAGPEESLLADPTEIAGQFSGITQ
ncbi:MAG: hypothetical protein ABIK96_10890 [bacterium]